MLVQVANAPHIPVHLGGMQAAVRFQIDSLGIEGIGRGDVILSNHPIAGGSHLPDLTVITPVFFGDSDRPDFFVANRGHHADIGGLVPGERKWFDRSLGWVYSFRHIRGIIWLIFGQFKVIQDLVELIYD